MMPHALLAIVAPLMIGMRALGAAPPADTITARGVVFDSVSGKPLAGALVELAGADSELVATRFTARSDSEGRFVISGISTGRYLAALSHPALDSLHLVVRNRSVSISAPWERVVLTTPSPATIVGAACANQRTPNRAPALLMGDIRRANGEPIADGGLTISWTSVEPAGDTAHSMATHHRTIRARPDGLFVVCGLPPDTALSIVAGNATDSSGAVTIQLPSNGLRSVAMLIASSRIAGSLNGTVVNESHAPLASARVSVGSHFATTGSDGRFSLDSIPAGSQTASVRAIGYDPQSIAVQIAEGSPATMSVTLKRITVLPMVSTWANAEHFEAFERHRKTNAGGYFITPPRLEGQPQLMSAYQLASGAPGTLYKNGKLLFRGQRPQSYCVPTLYVNGIRAINPDQGALATEPADNTRPDQSNPDGIGGVEVYTRASDVPNDYPMPKNGCGILAIWTR